MDDDAFRECCALSSENSVQPRGAAHSPAASHEAGLFGLDSVTWRVFAHPVVALGGLRSLYLQALHPRAAAAVAQNSYYETDPWRRLLRTWNYVRTVLYGSVSEAQEAAVRVRRRHARMRATDSRTGETFRCDDPDLLRWVHVAEVESFLAAARRAGLRLTPDEVDKYYAEQSQAAELMGLDAYDVPRSTAEVTAYYRAMRSELSLTADAGRIAAVLTAPPVPPEWSQNRAARLASSYGPPRWLYRGVAATAFALLPPWARELYGRRSRLMTDAAASASTRAFHLLVPAVLPRRYRVQHRRLAAIERERALQVTD